MRFTLNRGERTASVDAGTSASGRKVDRRTLVVKVPAAVGLTLLVSGCIKDGQIPFSGDSGVGRPDPEGTKRVDLDNLPKDWPISGAEAAVQMGLPKSAARYFIPGISDGKPTGEWIAEFFPLKDGVTYDTEKGVHMVNDEPTADPSKIFKFKDGDDYTTPEWQRVSNQSHGYLFARTGGAGPQEANTSRFAGDTGRVFKYVEQAALIPPPVECIDDIDTAAYRHAVREAATHKDITVKWAGDQDKVVTVDGKTLRAYLDAGFDQGTLMEVIDSMPVGYPVTPEGAVDLTGGTTRPENWTIEPENGKWTYEGFNLAGGVRYDAAGGVLRKGNEIMTKDNGYDYDNWEDAQGRWTSSLSMPEMPGVYMFARTGGGGNPANTSWYVIGGEVKTGRPGMEQAAIILVRRENDCTLGQSVVNVLRDDARQQAGHSDVKSVKAIVRGETTTLK